MADTLCTKCRNSECEYAGRKVWVMICAHEYMAPPMTNADRIRAMTDEELAEWLDNNTYQFPIYKDWLDWLRQEDTDADN